MSRKINKPEDAKPRAMISHPQYLHFTAAECAQIARAFKDSSEADCTWDEWESKFREWEKQE